MRLFHFFIAGIAAFLLVVPITAQDQVQAAAQQTYAVGVEDALLVRHAPSGEAAIIGHLRNGEHVTVLGIEYGWAQIEWGNETAWVAAHYLYPSEESKQKMITVMEDNVRVRTGPGTEYPITYITGINDSFELLGSDNDWHQIALADGNSGWIASWLTDTSPTTTPNSQVETVSSEPTTSRSSSLSDYTVVLDAGHGGKDPGAIATDDATYEKQLTLETVEEVADRLQQTGVNVILTRKDDTYLSLNERASFSNTLNPDAFISFHYNSSPIRSATGISTFYHGGEAREFANSLHQGLISYTKLADRGTRQEDYRVLRKNDNIAALVELGFLSNPEEFSIIRTEAYQNEVAEGITAGIKNYLADN